MKFGRRFMYVADKSKVEIVEEHKYPEYEFDDFYKYRQGMVLKRVVRKHLVFSFKDFNCAKPSFGIRHQVIRCVIAKNRTQAIRWLKREWHRKHKHGRVK